MPAVGLQATCIITATITIAKTIIAICRPCRAAGLPASVGTRAQGSLTFQLLLQRCSLGQLLCAPLVLGRLLLSDLARKQLLPLCICLGRLLLLHLLLLPLELLLPQELQLALCTTMKGRTQVVSIAGAGQGLGEPAPITEWPSVARTA